MALGAVLAAALTDHSPRIFGLWVNGLDVLKQPGDGGNLYGVPVEGIDVTEAGPGGVSSMRFSIEDPLGQVGIPPKGSNVRYHDLANDHPEFTGYVQAVSVRPHSGRQGRFLDVEAVGVEAILDWVLAPATTYPASTFQAHLWQSAAQYSPLRVAWQQPAPGQGTQAAPIGANAGGAAGPVFTSNLATLRETIQAIYTSVPQAPETPQGIAVTVDFTFGLRVWFLDTFGSVTLGAPDDYATMTIVDTVAGPLRAEDLKYDLTYLDAPVAAYVTGAGGTVYGPFSDGTGNQGPQVSISDTSVTSAAQAASVAQAYLGVRAAAVRGSFRLNDWMPGAANYRAGSKVVITDAAVSLVAGSFTIYQIAKTYHGDGAESWVVSFGGLAPSGMTLVRRLTRATLS